MKIADKVIVPKGFRGLIYEPNSEQETIALFLLLMKRIRPSWCIKKLQTAFPDGVFYDTNKKKDVRVEFEYKSSSFIGEHDEKGCDIIICWKNDLSAAETKKMRIKILPLKTKISRMSVGNIFLGKKQEGSPDDLVQEGVRNKDRVAINVNDIVNNKIPNLITRYASKLYLGGKKHYTLRWERTGILGIYPSGRLVANKVEEYVKRFGKNITPAAKRFRDIIKDDVKGLNVSPKFSDKELGMRKRKLVKAIKEFCDKLKRQK